MNEYYTEISEQIKIVREVKERAQRFLASAPEGVLRVTNSHGSFQYRVRSAAGGPAVYLKKKDMELARTLAQKEYCQRAFEKAAAVEAELVSFEKRNIGRSASFMYSELSEVYNTLPQGKKNLTEPYVLPDEIFIKEWLERPDSRLGFKEGTPEIYSERGERVRSKSEKMIADKLYMLGIPYRYESSLILQSGEIVHPDFTILDIAERKDIIFEHFGLMGDEDYQNRAAWKLETYIRNGYMPGETFLFTMETADRPLDLRSFEKMIRNRLRMPAAKEGKNRFQMRR